MLTPFIIYIFVFCMVHFVNRVSLSPVMFLRPSAPFRNDIRVVICAFIILIAVSYTHLDVYKRQLIYVAGIFAASIIPYITRIDFSGEWGKIWGTLGKTTAGTQYGIQLAVSPNIIACLLYTSRCV